MFTKGLPNEKLLFQNGTMSEKKFFLRHIANKFRRPNILQLNIKGLTASQTNVLCYLALQLKALVILLQETHCFNAEKLVLSSVQLAGFFWSRKHGLATFFHERLMYTVLDQSPPTSAIEWCALTLIIIK